MSAVVDEVGFRKLTNYIARALLETGGSDPDSYTLNARLDAAA